MSIDHSYPGRSSPNPTLGSSPGPASIMSGVDQSPPPIMPYPNPHVPPFPSPTFTPLNQPVSQLRQPYLLSSLQQLGGSVSKKGGSRPSSNFDDVPIRLACTFAPSRAWLMGTQHNMFTRTQKNKNIDALYVMANHGVLLEYSLDPIPESSKIRIHLAEKSIGVKKKYPIERSIVSTPIGSELTCVRKSGSPTTAPQGVIAIFVGKKCLFRIR